MLALALAACAPPEDLQRIVEEPLVKASCSASCPGAGHVYVVEDRRPKMEGTWCFCACARAEGVPAEFSYRIPTDGDPALNAQLERWLWLTFEKQYCAR